MRIRGDAPLAEKKKLGEMLKDANLIDEFQLETALSHQRNWGGKLGSILIEMDFVREEDVARTIAEKMGIPYVNLFDPELPPEAIQLIKPDIAKKYLVVPIRKEGQAIIVAMSDPMDIRSLDDLRFSTGLKIKPSLALESEIRDALKKYYDGEDVVRAVKIRTSERQGKMETIFGNDLIYSGNQEQPAVQAEKADNTAEESIRLNALIQLLIEKELITRDELIKMIYQKKMGL
jgi:type IV pilus assembly protein PilB